MVGQPGEFHISNTSPDYGAGLSIIRLSLAYSMKSKTLIWQVCSILKEVLELQL